MFKFKVELDKQLSIQKQNDEKIYKKISPVEEFKLLTDVDRSEDLLILKNLTNNVALKSVTLAKGRKLEFEAMEKQYIGALYTESQIKKLCIDYNLRFLKSTLYTANIDVEVTAKVKQFCKDNNLDLARTLDQNRFKIMAPKEMFALKEVTYKTAATQRKEDDPVLFFDTYETVNNEPVYAYVHKWGHDFTVMRYINAFKWRGFWNYMAFHTACLFPIVSFLISWFIPIHIIVNLAVTAIFLSLVVSFAIAYFAFGIHKQDEGKIIKNHFSKFCWNSEEIMTGKS